MPIGFKNGTSGDMKVAVDAVVSASHSHAFPGVTREGHLAVVHTKGNPCCHVIMRGGTQTGPQYTREWLDIASEHLSEAGVSPHSLMVDCSHGNAQKLHRNQIKVSDCLAQQLRSGEHRIVGCMLESNICEGRQSIPERLTDLVYGTSVTDPCIDLETTCTVIERLSESVRQRRQMKSDSRVKPAGMGGNSVGSRSDANAEPS